MTGDDSELINEYEKSGSFNMPSHDVSFSAFFEANEYTLYFYNWDGSLVNGDTKIKFNSPVSSSSFPKQNPTREGHTFGGWNMTGDDSELINEYEKSGSFNMPSHDVSFSAYFEINEYTLYFYNWDESLIEGNTKIKFNVTVDSSYFPEKNPTKEGFIFDEWSMNGNESELIGDYEKNRKFSMPNQDVSFTAKFISDTVQIVFGTVILEKDLKETLKKYTDKNEYTIVRIEENGGKTTVIVRFNDAQDAKGFSRDLEQSEIRTSYVIVEEGSLSRMIMPSYLIFSPFY